MGVHRSNDMWTQQGSKLVGTCGNSAAARAVSLGAQTLATRGLTSVLIQIYESNVAFEKRWIRTFAYTLNR